MNEQQQKTYREDLESLGPFQLASYCHGLVWRCVENLPPDYPAKFADLVVELLACDSRQTARELLEIAKKVWDNRSYFVEQQEREQQLSQAAHRVEDQQQMVSQSHSEDEQENKMEAVQAWEIITARYSTVQAFLEAYAAHCEHLLQAKEYPCRGELRFLWLCCQEHRRLIAENAVLAAWAEHFHKQYALGVIQPAQRAWYWLDKGSRAYLLGHDWIMYLARAAKCSVPSSLLDG